MFKYYFIIPFALMGAACAPFSSGSEPTLEERVQRQDIQLRQMQPQQADAWNQLQAMKQEIESLKGQLDELNNAGGARAIADRVRQHDTALRQVDNSMGLNLDLGTPITAAPAQSLPVPQSTTVQAMPGAQAGIPMTGMEGLQPTGAPDSSAYGAARTVAPNPAADPMQQASYGMPVEAAPVAAPPAPTESTWGQADPQPEPVVAAEPKKDIATALFDAGVNSFNARDYGAAERSFSDFIKNYPSNSQIAQAQYYIAECQFQRNRFPEAALAYENVIKKYPKSSSAPGAYLKQAISFSKMSQPAAAKARMQEIIKKYPNSPEAARAKTFLKTNK